MTIEDDYYSRPLPPEEFERSHREIAESVKGPNGDAIAEQIAWFLRTYPSPLDRIAYTRRKFIECAPLRGVLRKNI